MTCCGRAVRLDLLNEYYYYYYCHDLKVPLADGGVVDERGDERQVDGVGDAALTQLALPRVEQLGAEFLVERTRVRQEPRQQQHVTYQPTTRTYVDSRLIRPIQQISMASETALL